ncbi:uncharacterized protein LOC130713166 [Lotus japonicus]|uniref:uncharacterized protein LOC130713166 n=1 Tax=Lotus japonicus TaxID=34305 RepID=UPI002589104C|nr:uncharacterized protein LOC130713166 [Lotus japonicus]
MAANHRDKADSKNPVEELDLQEEVRKLNVAFKGMADLVGQTLLQNKEMKAAIQSLEKHVRDMQLVILSLEKTPSSSIVDGLVNEKRDGVGEATQPLRWNSRSNSPPMNKVAKTSQGPSPTQALIGAYRKEEASLSNRKKLFNSPDESQNKVKTPIENEHASLTPVGVIKCPQPPTGQTLPEGIPSNFPPTGDMLLLRSEVILACYVFHPDLDSTEVLIRIGNLKVNRLDLHCFCPGIEISPEIITLLTMKTTHNQHHSTFQTTWALPPSFVDDVLNGHTISELGSTYADVWMKPMDYLKYVYVPIRDEQGHWFLMVISLEDEAVYHLDSYLGHLDIMKRKESITVVTRAISEIVSTGTYSRHLIHIAQKLKAWKIIEPTGIPNCGKSDDSAVYVMDWLQMEEDFNPQITCDLNIGKTRMTSLMKLLTGFHNEERLKLILKSNSYWKFVMSQIA